MIDYSKAKDVNEIDWDLWKGKERAVITYIFSGDKVLLMIKKRGLGEGKVNAPGGHIEEGETPLQAAIRECEEEVGLTPLNCIEVGSLSFQFTNGMRMEGTVFIAYDYKGRLVETDEADPFWIEIDNIPYTKMWEDDLLWLPHVIKGKKIEGRFIFKEDKMLSYKMEINER